MQVVVQQVKSSLHTTQKEASICLLVCGEYLQTTLCFLVYIWESNSTLCIYNANVVELYTTDMMCDLNWKIE